MIIYNTITTGTVAAIYTEVFIVGVGKANFMAGYRSSMGHSNWARRMYGRKEGRGWLILLLDV